MTAFFALVGRDIRLVLRQPGEAALALLFFLLGGAIFPLGLGPDPLLLARIAPGLIWAMALFAALLSLDRLFQADHEDGTLDQLALAALPLWTVGLAKTLAHWTTHGLPLLLVAPLLALAFDMPASGLPALLAGLALGGPLMTLIGAIGAALTLGARRSGAILPLLVLPLYVPVLIFGAQAGAAVRRRRGRGGARRAGRPPASDAARRADARRRRARALGDRRRAPAGAGLAPLQTPAAGARECDPPLRGAGKSRRICCGIGWTSPAARRILMPRSRQNAGTRYRGRTRQ